MRRILWAAGLTVASLLGALFLVFQPLFTDGPVDPFHWERLVSYAITATGFGVAAWAGTRFGPWDWQTLAWLGVPGLIVIVAYHDPPTLARVLVASSMAVGLALGALIGRVAGRPAPAVGQ